MQYIYHICVGSLLIDLLYSAISMKLTVRFHGPELGSH